MISVTWNNSERVYVLSSSVTLPVPQLELFDFFSDACQLEQITPPWLNFRVLTPTPIAIRAGTVIDYRLRLRFVPIRWRTEISTWNPPHSFTDRQLKGPYLLWEHRHTFDKVDGGTQVNDRVKYRVPGGRVVNVLFVKKDLLKIFRYRRRRMLELFGNNADTC